MNLVYEARSVLEEAGYSTMISDPAGSTFYFEDDSLLGFLEAHLDTESILKSWEPRQDAFLRHHAVHLRRHPNKAWNVYSIHLTSDKPTPQVRNRLYQIEEDFRGSRKLIRAGVETKSHLQRALLPLLPIQNVVTMRIEDAYNRLQERISVRNSSLLGLLGPTPSHELASLLTEEE